MPSTELAGNKVHLDQSDYDQNLIHFKLIAELARLRAPRSILACPFGRLVLDVYPWTDVTIDVFYGGGDESLIDIPAEGECHELVVLRGAVDLAMAGVSAPLAHADAKLVRFADRAPYTISSLPGAAPILLRYRHRRRGGCLDFQPGRLRHLQAWQGIAGVGDVVRRHADDRGRRYGDVFSTEKGDINITWAYPGVITAWHAHAAQDDNWFVIGGALKVGLATRGEQGFESRFVHCSEYEQTALQIPVQVLHGWRNMTGQEAILMYYITRKYDPANPDELRYSLDEVGADWSTPVH
ncbi:MAG: hypothetical protein ACR2PL_25090 [Dehalococcoidia bacterium]